MNETKATEECSGFDAPSKTLERNDYDFLIRHSTWEEPSNRKVVLVVLDSNIEPDDVITDFCVQREFTARLIDRLNRLPVSVIALDKIYMRWRCADGDTGTKNLQDAVQRSRARIIRGLDAEIVPETQLNDQKVCLSLRGASNLPLDVQEGNSGLLRMDPNTKLAPLAWPVHRIDEKDNIDKVEDLPTLSFLTAKSADPQAVQTRILQRALGKHQQPYTTRVNIPGYSAAKVLCGSTYTKTTDWRGCNSEEQPSELIDAVVMFGDHFGDPDRHPDARNFRGVYGVDLQANYVAAILDKRYYTPLSSKSDLMLIGAAMLFLHLCFHFFKPLWRTFLIAVGVWLFVVLISFPIISYTGYLFTIWMHSITFATIVVTALHHWTTTHG